MKKSRRLLASLIVCAMLIATLASTGVFAQNELGAPDAATDTFFAFGEDEAAVKIEVRVPDGANEDAEDLDCAIAVATTGGIIANLAEWSSEDAISELGVEAFAKNGYYFHSWSVVTQGEEGTDVVVNEDGAEIGILNATGVRLVANFFTSTKYVRYYESHEAGSAFYQSTVNWISGSALTQDLTVADFETGVVGNNTGANATGDAYALPEGKEAADFLGWTEDNGSYDVPEIENEGTFAVAYNDTVIDFFPMYEDETAPDAEVTVNLVKRAYEYEEDARKTDELIDPTYYDESETWFEALTGVLGVGAIKLGFVENLVSQPVEEGEEAVVPANIVEVKAADPDVLGDVTRGIDEGADSEAVQIYVQAIAEDATTEDYLTEEDLADDTIVWTTLTYNAEDDVWTLAEADFADADEDGIVDDANVATLIAEGIYVVYAKVADQTEVPNVAYISSEGIMLDGSAPTLDFPECACEGECTCGKDAGEDVDLWFGTGFTNIVVRDNLSGIAKIEYRVWEKIGLDQTEFVSDTTLLASDAIYAGAEDEDDKVSVYGNSETFTEGKFRIMWPTWGFYEILVWVTDNAGNMSVYKIEVGDIPPVIIPISVPVPVPLFIFIPDEEEPTTTPEVVPSPDTNDNSGVELAMILAGAALMTAGAVTVVAKKKRKVTE